MRLSPPSFFSSLQSISLAVPWLLWPIALLAGIVIVVGSLSYVPNGRINVLWIWLLWAGLPLLGSLASLWAIFFGGRRPWLFQWRKQAIYWHPSSLQRLDMLGLLQRFWCLVALGMLVGYWALLLFTDLAFGWSSTLIDGSHIIVQLAQVAAKPWQWLWPAAVPDAALIEATRYIRIASTAENSAVAGNWWRFLMASLLFYNLLPRLLLGALIAVRRRGLRGRELNLRIPDISRPRDSTAGLLQEDSLDQWQDALKIYWEIKSSANSKLLHLGVAEWQDDERALKQLLRQPPRRILWQVNASRSPVAELSDLIAMARAAGVNSHALLAASNATTDPTRHLASWRAFADRQQLVWLKDFA